MIKTKLFYSIFASIVLLSTIKASPSNHTGFSIGCNVGHESVSGEVTHFSNLTEKLQVINDSGSSSPVIGIFGAYGFIPYNVDLYFGGEIFLQHENINQKNRIIYKDTVIKTNNSSGVAAKVGYPYKEYLFFIKTGVSYMNHFRENEFPRLRGFLLGGGVDCWVNRNWAVGVEFIYEDYKPVTIKSNHVSGLQGTIKYDPSKYTSNLRLKYTF